MLRMMRVTVICAKFGKDLFNISKGIGRKTKWPRYFWPTRYRLRWYRKAFLSYGASNDGEIAKTSLHTHTAQWRLSRAYLGFLVLLPITLEILNRSLPNLAQITVSSFWTSSCHNSFESTLENSGAIWRKTLTINKKMIKVIGNDCAMQ